MADPRGDLIDALAAQLGIPSLTPSEIDSVLELAAVAAHGTGDRTSAPLVSFLAGIAAAGAGDRTASLDAVKEHAATLTATGSSPS